MHTLNLNGQTYKLDVPDDMPLLWVIRDVLGKTGTKFGCGIGQCGSCSMHLDGEVIRSCITPIESAKGKKVETIEAMEDDPIGQKVQQAWLEEGVPQCGYCQGGQIMTATALLKVNSSPGNDLIEEAMTGNICRCGTYNRIKSAIHTASTKIKEDSA